ncbi:hypothetical protein SAMN06298226_2874 [Nitrosovibrio sp. Nv4]|nr:hypothetical protein SAMN06298226_2874 [Nitrosovibrio sp. Nv4]
MFVCMPNSSLPFCRDVLKNRLILLVACLATYEIPIVMIVPATGKNKKPRNSGALEQLPILHEST